MFTIPPLMVLESKHIRKSMIRWYDKKYYGEERVRDDPRFAQAYAGLDEMHKQGFWTGLFSRIGALTPLLLTVMLDKPREWSEPYFDGVAKGSGHVYTAVGLTKERPLQAPFARRAGTPNGSGCTRRTPPSISGWSPGTPCCT
ncbi:MAG: hypothetical protein WDN72_03610 [Alphaproteobacteria bacterium]